MQETLFPIEHYRDPDYHAACMLVAEIVGGNPDEIELLPGVPSCEFCPIALTLDALDERLDPDVDVAEFIAADPDERRRIYEAVGGSSYLYAVSGERVRSWEIELGWDDEMLDSGAWELDADGEMARRVYPISDDAWGAGCGDPARFIERFDAGEFPALHLDIAP